MKSICQDERGIALLGAIMGLILMGALVSLTFGPTLFEQRLAENARRSEHAFSVAEYGLSEAIGSWDTGTWNSLGVADSATFSGTTADGRGSYSGTVQRMSNELFLVTVTGNDPTLGARQRLGQFARLQLIEIDIKAALTTRGPTKLGGSAEIDGNDTSPAGWGCGTEPDTTMAGIRLSSADDLTTTGGCSAAGCIDGNPGISLDSTIADSTFFQYGDVDWDDLVSMATITLPAGNYRIAPEISAGACTNSITNWGDPLTPSSPCFDRFPIIYAQADLTINQNLGQGILLVEGDLSVQGGFRFYGIVIVKGRLKTTGTGGHFNGAVMAANVDLDNNTVLGNALVQFSSCTVHKTLSAASPATLLRSRGWVYAF
jgi:hypothetical protein